MNHKQIEIEVSSSQENLLVWHSPSLTVFSLDVTAADGNGGNIADMLRKIS